VRLQSRRVSRRQTTAITHQRAMVVSGCGRSDRREIPTASHKSKGKGMGPDTGDLLQSLLMTFTTVISPANV
jgi:hypothetical protein